MGAEVLGQLLQNSLHSRHAQCLVLLELLAYAAARAKGLTFAAPLGL